MVVLSQEQEKKFLPLIYSKTEEIGSQFSLDIDGIGYLQVIVVSMLRGQSSIDTLIKDIEEQLEVPETQARSIAIGVENEILKEIEKQLSQAPVEVPKPTTVVETPKPIEPVPVPQPIAEIPESEPAPIVQTPVSQPIVEAPKPVEPAPAPIPFSPEAPVAATHPINITEEVKKPEPQPVIEEHVHENLPAIQEEREVTIRRIVTPDPVLNKQLEVPVVRNNNSLHTAPVMQSFIPEKPVVEAPKPQPVVETPKPTPVVTPIQNPTPSIVDARLGIKPVSMPKEDLDFSKDKKHDGVQYPPRYTKDPYREPIE